MHGEKGGDDHTANRTKVTLILFLKKIQKVVFHDRKLMPLQLVTWYHRVKIAALVLVWIFFTYLLMTYDEKEIERRQLAVLPFETKGKC